MGHGRIQGAIKACSKSRKSEAISKRVGEKIRISKLKLIVAPRQSHRKSNVRCNQQRMTR